MIIGPLLLILTVIFIVLKLAGVLAVGWGVALLPLWVFLLLVGIIFWRLWAASR